MQFVSTIGTIEIEDKRIQIDEYKREKNEIMTRSINQFNTCKLKLNDRFNYVITINNLSRELTSNLINALNVDCDRRGYLQLEKIDSKFLACMLPYNSDVFLRFYDTLKTTGNIKFFFNSNEIVPERLKGDLYNIKIPVYTAY